MQSPTSKDKGLIGMPLQIEAPGGIQSESPSCIRGSGNCRASSEHPPRKFQENRMYVQKLAFRLVAQLQSHLLSRVSFFVSCLVCRVRPEARVLPRLSSPVSSHVSCILTRLVPRLVPRLVSRLMPEYAEFPEYLEYPEHPEYPIAGTC